MKKTLLLLTIIWAFGSQIGGSVNAQEAGDFNIRYGLAARNSKRVPALDGRHNEAS